MPWWSSAAAGPEVKAELCLLAFLAIRRRLMWQLLAFNMGNSMMQCRKDGRSEDIGIKTAGIRGMAPAPPRSRSEMDSFDTSQH